MLIELLDYLYYKLQIIEKYSIINAKLIQNLKTFLILPPQRLLSNNHNMHVSS